MPRSSRRRKAYRNSENVDRSWMKWSKCSICRGKFCVNNYADRKVRIPKLAGYIVCLNCQHRDGAYLIKLRVIVDKVSKQRPGPNCNGTLECKCLPCVAYRVLEAHDVLPVRK